MLRFARMHATWKLHPVTLAFGGVLLASRVVLAIVFAVAGIAKLRDPVGTAQMLRDFGSPRSSAVVFARLLPLAELVVAAALVPTASARWGGVAAFVLLAAFTAAIVVNLALGKKPACRCFGQVASAPIGPATLVRNVALLAAATLVALVPATQLDPMLFAEFDAQLGWVVAIAVLFGFLAVQTFLMLQILRQQGRMLLRLELIEGSEHGFAHNGHANGTVAQAGLAVGTSAPAFDLPSLAGKRATLAEFLALGRRVVLLFAHPACGPCEALLPDVARWQTEHEKQLTFVIVSEGAVKENRGVFTGGRFRNVLLQTKTEVSDAYLSYGTPAALVVEADGAIGSNVAAGADAIRALVANAAEPEIVRAGSGEAAPEFSGRTAKGETIELVQFRGRDVVVLFWSPDCGFCRAAADDVARWDRESAAPLLIVSSREDDDLSGRRLRAPLLIDETGHIGQSFGATGTPMAVHVDAGGKIASDVAAGKDAIGRLIHALVGSAPAI